MGEEWGGGVHGDQFWPMDYMCVKGYDLKRLEITFNASEYLNYEF